MLQLWSSNCIMKEHKESSDYQSESYFRMPLADRDTFGFVPAFPVTG